MARSRMSLSAMSPGLARTVASPSSYVEEVARRQWDSLKKTKPAHGRGRSSSCEAAPSRPTPVTPAQAAAALRQRLDASKRERHRSRSRSGDRDGASSAVSENFDCNVSRALPHTPQSAASKPGHSSIMEAAERTWEELHSSRRGSKRSHGTRHGASPGGEPWSAEPTPRGSGSPRAEEPVGGPGARRNELPPHLMSLLVQVCSVGGDNQELAAEKLRDLVHDGQTAKIVAEEEWALEALARPLIDGSTRARVACAACFRHLALDSGGSKRILHNPLILTALVAALQQGADEARQKAAAALGNLAWRSEASREVIMNTAGVMDGLLQMLHLSPPSGRESALAALSNLTLNQRCTTELVLAPQALSELVSELQTGSAKGQLRAAGIMRNLASKSENHAALTSFPGAVPVLQRLAVDCTHEETRLRAAKALRLLTTAAGERVREQGFVGEETQKGGVAGSVLSTQSSGAFSSRGRSSPSSLSPVSVSSPGHVRRRSSASSPPSAALADFGETGDGKTRGLLSAARRALLQPDHKQGPPRMPVNSYSRRSSPQKETTLREKIETMPTTEQATDATSPTCSSPALLSSDDDEILHHGWHAAASPETFGMTGGVRKVGAASCLLASLLGEGMAESQQGAGLYRSDDEESRAVEQVLRWISVNGWDGIQERLFDMGETDYALWAKLEPHMVAVNATRGVYLLKGHQVQFIGTDRYNPTMLLHAESKEVLWDVEAHTKYTFPLARKYLVCKVEGDTVHILLKSSGKSIATKGGGALEQVQDSQRSPTSETNLSSHAALPSISPSLSPGRSLSRSITLGPEHGDAPAPVPQLSSPSPLRDPPQRPADAVAKNANRDIKLISGNAQGARATLEEAGEHARMLAMRGLGRSHQGLSNSIAEPPASLGSPSSKLPDLSTISSAATNTDNTSVASAAYGLAKDAAEDGMVDVKLSNKRLKTPCNPDLWREMMTEGVADDCSPDTFLFRNRKLTLPVYGADGLAIVRDAQSGESFYVGPGRHEVFLPTKVAADSEVVKQLMGWANVHGWHDLSRRLLDQGHTDYTKYAEIDQEMQPLVGAGKEGLFAYRGRTLRLFGPSRWDPKELKDIDSGEVVWDYITATKLRFPWARQAFEIQSDLTHVHVCDRRSKKLLVKLELACYQDIKLSSPPAAAVSSRKMTPARPHSAVSPPQTQASISNRPGAAGVYGGLVEAIIKLKEWAEQKGWFDLEARLLDAGSTDYRMYGDMERRMQAISGREGIFSLDGRQVQVIGHRLDPVKVVDVGNGEVVWDAEAHTTYTFPWARQAFAVRTLPSAALQIVERQTGILIVQVGGAASGQGESDALILQSILMDAVPALQRPGLEPLVQAGNDIVQVLKSFAPPTEGAGAAKTQAQLAIQAGDLLLVTHAGVKGWQLGRLLDLGLSDPLKAPGKEGWFPATYAAPVQELALWRGRVIQIGAPEPDGVVTVTDTTSGNVIFWGHPQPPHEDWNMSHASVRAALDVPTASDPLAAFGTSPRNAGSPRKGAGVLSLSPMASVGSPRLQLIGTPRVQPLDLTGRVAAWRDNQQRFLQCAASDVLLDGHFSCKSHIGIGGSNGVEAGVCEEETLEMRASGTFRYIAWSKQGLLSSQDQQQGYGGGRRGGKWVVLGGLYKLSLQGQTTGHGTLLLSVQTAAEASTRPAALAAPVRVIHGAFVRGHISQDCGQFQQIEWASGHAEIGMGACGAPLTVVYVTVC